MRALTCCLFGFLFGCIGNIAAPSLNEQKPIEIPPASEPDPQSVVTLPAAASCDGTALGRRYLGFAGEALDGDRLPLAAGQDTKRVRDGSDLGNFFESRQVGGAPLTQSIVQTFGVTPERWYINNQASFASVYAAYSLAFHGCLMKIQRPADYHPFGEPDFAAAPTSASAQRQCQVMGKLLWWRPMDSEELVACVDYALEVITLEPNVKRQWAYVCASVAGSASFLIY